MITPVMPTYGEAVYSFARGEGSYLYTADEQRFLDFTSGMAVNALGHCHPHLVETLAKQGETLWHSSNLYGIADKQRLAERLVAHSFADTMMFSNSGAEALECSFKIARRYHYSAGNPERYRIIAFDGAFHGRTLAAVAAGSKGKNREGFAPTIDGFDHVAFGNLNELRAAITPETAAILIEPVQGEGGIHLAEAEFLRGLRGAADEFGLLLIFDEVQCGMGRTGKLFAHEWAGVTPDVMAVAKALGGGFPVAACLATERAAACMTRGSHGSTFGGNPLAMAVANAVLDLMLADGFLENVERIGKILRRRLDALADKYPTVIEEVRGGGLMIGIQLCPNRDAGTVVAALGEQRLLTVSATGNVIRLLPPLIIKESHVDEAVAALDTVFAKISP